MVSTYVFGGLAGAKDAPTVQLQLKPRVNNVDIDLADVRFALWLNGRPHRKLLQERRGLAQPKRQRFVGRYHRKLWYPRLRQVAAAVCGQSPKNFRPAEADGGHDRLGANDSLGARRG